MYLTLAAAKEKQPSVFVIKAVISDGEALAQHGTETEGLAGVESPCSRCSL